MFKKAWSKTTLFTKKIKSTSRVFLAKWWVLLVLIFTYSLLRYISFSVVPDILEISSLKASDYFNVVIGATASIFGILIAVVLLTFELIKNSLFRKAEANIFNNPIVTNFVSLGIITIVLSFISYVTIQKFDNPVDLTIGYFIGYIFVIFLFSIYPFMKGLLYSTSGLKSCRKLIASLSIKDFDVVDFDTNSVSLLEDSRTPLYQIRSELISMVRENDFQGYNMVLGWLNSKVIELQADGMNRYQMAKIQKGLILVWKGANLEAKRVGNHQYFDSIWESILSLYVEAIAQKHPYLHYQEIDFYQRDFIAFLSRNSLGDNLATGAKILSNVFRFSLESNCPRQEKLYDLYKFFGKEGGDIRNSDYNTPHI